MIENKTKKREYDRKHLASVCILCHTLLSRRNIPVAKGEVTESNRRRSV
jgi:hypothetical protein